MKTKLLAGLTVLVVSLVAVLQLPALGAENAEKIEKAASLPASSQWKLHFDATLDGVVIAGQAAVPWEVVAQNNRIHVEGGTSWVVNGELVDAKCPLVTLRQDGAKGFVAIYAGKRSEDGNISGTWFNTKGESGDFELTRES